MKLTTTNGKENIFFSWIFLFLKEPSRKLIEWNAILNIFICSYSRHNKSNAEKKREKTDSKHIQNKIIKFTAHIYTIHQSYTHTHISYRHFRSLVRIFMCFFHVWSLYRYSLHIYVYIYTVITYFRFYSFRSFKNNVFLLSSFTAIVVFIYGSPLSPSFHHFIPIQSLTSPDVSTF